MGGKIPVFSKTGHILCNTAEVNRLRALQSKENHAGGCKWLDGVAKQPTRSTTTTTTTTSWPASVYYCVFVTFLYLEKTAVKNHFKNMCVFLMPLCIISESLFFFWRWDLNSCSTGLIVGGYCTRTRICTVLEATVLETSLLFTLQFQLFMLNIE